jgi:DinB family protein
VTKSLSNPSDQQEILQRLGQLSPQDTGLWGKMTVHQMVCHLRDSYQIPLGERTASPAETMMPRAVFKRLALYAPMQWPKGVPTRPEVEQGKGGTAPGEFATDLAALVITCNRFYAGLPSPCVPHSIFGSMSVKDWMRWGYLHADHHLRQFGR